MSDQRNMQTIRVLAIKATAGAGIGTSQQITEDPFKDAYGPDGVLEPPYPLLELSTLTEASDILRQCIDAYQANITGFGWAVKYNIDYESNEVSQEVKNQADAEWATLEQFLLHCNPERSFTKLNKMIVGDKELTGISYLEVLPYGDGEPCGFEYIPSHTIRMSPLDTQVIMVKRTILTPKGPQEVKWPMRFRRFLQIRGTSRTWFKQFGDPRILDRVTGQYVPDGQKINADRIANAILSFKIDVSWSSYGVPRYMGALMPMLGSRKAEELNNKYFDKGRHIPLAIVVENGMLTKKSFEELTEYMAGLEGVSNAHGFLLLEAEGIEKNATGEQADVKIRFEKLVDIMPKDALFLQYSEKSRNKVRSQFRLPGLYTGDSQDFTRATAYEAKKTTEEQVFQPEREELAHIYNNTVLPALGIKYVSLYFKGPSLSDQKEKSIAIAPYITAGAATPNMLLDALGELLGKTFEPFVEDWGNKPMALALKELELAAAASAAEPITASVELTVDPDDEILDEETKTIKQEILKLQKSTTINIIQILKELRDDIREALKDVA